MFSLLMFVLIVKSKLFLELIVLIIELYKSISDNVKLTKTITPINYEKASNAQMYVIIDDIYYFCSTVSNSVKTIANKYITEYINLDIVYDHRIALKYLINS